jgi:CRP-like cAMP-binding protein
MSEPAHALAAIPLFAGLAAPELERLAGLAEQRTFERDQEINREGGPWEGLYIVRSGKVKLSKRATGRELTIAIMEPGQPLNIAPLFEGGPNVFQTEAMGRVSCYYLPAEAARAFVSDHPAVQSALLRALNLRIRRLASLASEVSFTGVTGRLAAWVLEEARRKGVRTERGLAVRRDLSMRELASLLGTVRRVLSRAVAELRRDGAIEVTPEWIVIRAPKRLRARAGER